MKIITICGSTKFKDKTLELAKELTLEGNIVLMPFVFAHQGDVISDEQKEKLDLLHKEKIRMSDEIYVVMVDNYIGSSTRGEIEFAQILNKPINYRNY